MQFGPKQESIKTAAGETLTYIPEDGVYNTSKPTRTIWDEIKNGDHPEDFERFQSHINRVLMTFVKSGIGVTHDSKTNTAKIDTALYGMLENALWKMAVDTEEKVRNMDSWHTQAEMAQD